MAGIDHTTIAPGVRRCNCSWGYILEGRRDDLLAANLAQPEWFANGDQRDKYGRTVRSIRAVHEGRKIECRQVTKHRYDIRVHYTRDDEAAYAHRAKLQAALEAEEKAIAALCGSHADFRKQANYSFEFASTIIRNAMVKFQRDGYQLPWRDIKKIDKTLDKIARIIRNASVEFYESGRTGSIARIKAATAKADDQLQALLTEAIDAVAAGKVIEAESEAA